MNTWMNGVVDRQVDGCMGRIGVTDTFIDG